MFIQYYVFLDPLNMKLMKIFNNSVRTSKKTTRLHDNDQLVNAV
jgi:hypothetical protein